MLRIYIIGLSILIVAIAVNAVIGKLGLLSWYDFINQLTDYGANTFKKMNVLDYVWLFVGYPIILGCGYLLGDKIYNVIFS